MLVIITSHHRGRPAEHGTVRPPAGRLAGKRPCLLSVLVTAGQLLWPGQPQIAQGGLGDHTQQSRVGAELPCISHLAQCFGLLIELSVECSVCRAYKTRYRFSTVVYFTFIFVYRLYHLGRRGEKERFVCCTSECLGRMDVIQR